MKKIFITTLALFTVVTANAQENHNGEISGDTVYANFSSFEVQTPWWESYPSNQVNPNEELCDTIFLLQEFFDANIKNFIVDTMLCFQCVEKNEITSYPNNCFENFPIGSIYIQNGIKRRKE